MATDPTTATPQPTEHANLGYSDVQIPGMTRQSAASQPQCASEYAECPERDRRCIQTADHAAVSPLHFNRAGFGWSDGEARESAARVAARTTAQQGELPDAWLLALLRQVNAEEGLGLADDELLHHGRTDSYIRLARSVYRLDRAAALGYEVTVSDEGDRVLVGDRLAARLGYSDVEILGMTRQFAPQPTEPAPDDVNALAALIRRVDGSHTLGAAALAEALVSAGVHRCDALCRDVEADRDRLTQQLAAIVDTANLWTTAPGNGPGSTVRRAAGRDILRIIEQHHGARGLGFSRDVQPAPAGSGVSGGAPDVSPPASGTSEDAASGLTVERIVSLVEEYGSKWAEALSHDLPTDEAETVLAEVRTQLAQIISQVRGQVAEEITAHADRHTPGRLSPGRRWLLIAARVASGPITPEQAAQALLAGDYVGCRLDDAGRAAHSEPEAPGDWREKVATARDAREMGKQLRDGKEPGFRRSVGRSARPVTGEGDRG